MRFEYDGALVPEHGIEESDLAALAPRLEAVRDHVFRDADDWSSGKAVPDKHQPLDAGYVELPDRILAAYRKQGDDSELARVKATAERLGGEADRVVSLGIGGSYMGARAIFEALCDPYHNERSRAARGNRPRIYFAGHNVDNDALQSLLALLTTEDATSIENRFAIVVISKSGGTLETAVAFRKVLEKLVSQQGSAATADMIVPVTGKSGKLRDLARELGCAGQAFEIPDGVGGRFSVLTPVGLLPAALMGVDVVAILEGAVAMNEHFRTTPAAENLILQYIGVCHLVEKKQKCPIRVLSTWGQRLEAFGLWYDQLLAESLGKNKQGATPLTGVNTRDLHSRGQQHQEGARDKLINNLLVESADQPSLHVGHSDRDEDDLNKFGGKSLPEILAAAAAGTNQAYREARRPTTNLLLPHLDARTLGALFQMMMLATHAEGRLIGVNPFGQPGVEAYKKNMQAILSR